MPGIQITTNVRSGPSAGIQPPSGQFFVVGLFERGKTTAPTRLRSVADLNRNFGGRTPYSDAYDQLYTFFAEGGDQAYALRVVGEGAEVGTLALNDRATGEDTPLPTLTVNAASPGAWSNNLTVQIADGPADNSYRMTVRLNNNVVEDYNNLTSPEDAVAKFAGSPYVQVVTAGSTNEAPTNNPANLAPTSLSAGDDARNGTTVGGTTTGAVTSATYVNALELFPPELGDGCVAIPGQTGAAVFSGLITHAKANKRIALLAGSRGSSVANLQADVSSLNSEYAGYFAPWVVIPVSGSENKAISPEGYVAGVRARAHRQFGPWRAPAGQFAQSQHVVDIDQVFTATDADLLDASKISVIRKINNTVRLYGWRSVSNNFTDWAYLKDQDTINRIVVEAGTRLERYMFETIDGRGYLLSQISAELTGMLDPMAQADGLFGTYDAEGNEIDPGYVVNVGENVNSLSTLSQGIINAEIGVRISPVGSIINLVITKVGLLGSIA